MPEKHGIERRDGRRLNYAYITCDETANLSRLLWINGPLIALLQGCQRNSAFHQRIHLVDILMEDLPEVRQRIHAIAYKSTYPLEQDYKTGWITNGNK